MRKKCRHLFVNILVDCNCRAGRCSLPLSHPLVSQSDVELNEIAATKRSKYGQSSNKRSRGEFLKTVIRTEITNFASGAYEAPDLTNPDVVTTLREWNGAVQFVGKITLASFKDTLGGEIKTLPGYSENSDDYGGGNDDNDNVDDDNNDAVDNDNNNDDDDDNADNADDNDIADN